MKRYTFYLWLSLIWLALVAGSFVLLFVERRFLPVELRCRDRVARDRNTQQRNRFGQVC